MQQIAGLQSKDARSALGKSQGEVSKETGISRAYLSQFENGIRKLTDSELVVLKDYYEDLGFLFNSDSEVEPETRNVSSESLKLQEEIISASPGGEPILVSSIELSDLISAVDELASNAFVEKADSSNVQTESSVSVLLEASLSEQMEKEYQNTEKVLENLFAMDASGNLPEPSLLASYSCRSNKVISIMAVQYLRHLALSKGATLINIFDGVESISSNKTASKILDKINSNIEEETAIDGLLA